MSDEWEEYRSKLGANMPAALSTSTTSAKTAAGGKDAFSYLDRLKKSLEQKGLMDSEIENSLGHIDSSIRNMATIRLEAEEKSVRLMIKDANEKMRHFRTWYKKMTNLDSLIKLAETHKNMQKLERFKTIKAERLKSMAGALSSYSESIREINTFSFEAVKKGFRDYSDFILRRKDTDQVQILSRVRKHVDEYKDNKRVNIKQWEKDFQF